MKFFNSLGFEINYNDVDLLVNNLNIQISDEFVNTKEFARVFMNNFSTDI